MLFTVVSVLVTISRFGRHISRITAYCDWKSGTRERSKMAQYLSRSAKIEPISGQFTAAVVISFLSRLILEPSTVQKYTLLVDVRPVPAVHFTGRRSTCSAAGTACQQLVQHVSS